MFSRPEISGRENIYINGVVLGLTRRQVDQRFDAIVEFSGLGDFIDEPVKNYSSGMYVRLGFSVAIHTDPDVLLVDEVLAVGDEAFSHRCLRRIEEFLARGRTLLLVSHSLGLIEEFCDRALWLDHGRKRLLGSPRRVADAYRQDVAEHEGRGHLEAKEDRERQREGERAEEEPAETVPVVAEEASEPKDEEEPQRWGSREAEIVRARLLDAGGEERYHFTSGEPVTFEIEAAARQRLTDVVFGVGLFTPRGIECWGTNTALAGRVSETMEGSVTARVRCPALRLGPGEYLLDVALHAKDGYPYDYHRRILSFSVTAGEGGVGVYFPEHEWEFDGGIRWRTRQGG
jgi:energy-coupling factor transporter ATP-binding protein EcfA2